MYVCFIYTPNNFLSNLAPNTAMKKAVLLLLLVCIYPHFIFCQQNKIDSLEKVLKAEKEDTNKVNTLCSLSDELCDRSPKTAIELATEGLTLAKRLNFKKGVSISCNALTVISTIKESR